MIWLSIRLLAIITLILVIQLSNSFAYTIDGTSVFIEDANASLRVTPHTATSPINNFRQEFEVCNKTGSATTLYAAYVFDDALSSGAAEYWQPPVYGWVEYERTCNYDFNFVLDEDADQNPHRGWCFELVDQNGTDVNVIRWEREFKSGNTETGTIQFDVNKPVSGDSWLDVTSSFKDNYQVVNDRHVYPYIDGLSFPAGVCKTWAIEYSPDTSSDSNKWDLWLWADAESGMCILDTPHTCDKKLILDPWYVQGDGNLFISGTGVPVNEGATMWTWDKTNLTPIAYGSVWHVDWINDVCTWDGNLVAVTQPAAPNLASFPIKRRY